jgi:hypothetical protein
LIHGFYAKNGYKYKNTSKLLNSSGQWLRNFSKLADEWRRAVWETIFNTPQYFFELFFCVSFSISNITFLTSQYNRLLLEALMAFQRFFGILGQLLAGQRLSCQVAKGYVVFGINHLLRKLCQNRNARVDGNDRTFVDGFADGWKNGEYLSWVLNEAMESSAYMAPQISVCFYFRAGCQMFRSTEQSWKPTTRPYFVKHLDTIALDVFILAVQVFN